MNQLTKNMFRRNVVTIRSIVTMKNMRKFPIVNNQVRSITVAPDNKYVNTVIDTIFKCGLDEGIPYWPLSNSKQLAYEYKYDDRFESDQDRVDELIVSESAKSFGVGFLTGIGGVISLPIGLPAALMSSWILQVRLSGTIAELYGYDTALPLNRTRILLSMVDYPQMLKLIENKLNEDKSHDDINLDGKDPGDVIVSDIFANDKTTIKSEKIDQQLYIKAGQEIGLSRLPIGGYVLIQNLIVKHLIGTVGARAGVAGTGRAIPIIGGLVGGSVDTYTVNKVGNNSVEIFGKKK